jgi:hypothetical protein
LNKKFIISLIKEKTRKHVGSNNGDIRVEIRVTPKRYEQKRAFFPDEP